MIHLDKLQYTTIFLDIFFNFSTIFFTIFFFSKRKIDTYFANNFFKAGCDRKKYKIRCEFNDSLIF